MVTAFMLEDEVSTPPAPVPLAETPAAPPPPSPPREREIGGPSGLEPTRYGDWERKGRCIDF
jgi:hypothetical protein